MGENWTSFSLPSFLETQRGVHRPLRRGSGYASYLRYFVASESASRGWRQKGSRCTAAVRKSEQWCGTGHRVTLNNRERFVERIGVAAYACRRGDKEESRRWSCGVV